jgi:enamine deaminase RidA (YjgF/YER057c/UK114 family)
MTGKIEARLAELGIELPDAPAPVASYLPYVTTGNLVVTSGQITFWNGELKYVGRIGEGLSVEEAGEAARLCALNVLAQVRVACGGDLDRVRQVVRLNAFFNSTPEFTAHSKVMNYASDMMAEIFGEAGRHTRVGVGVPSLPLNVPVEIDGVFEIA